MNYFQRKIFGLGIALCLAFAVPAFAQPKSEREERGYKSRVKSVRTEVVSYSYESGRVKVGKRRLDLIENFDRFGNLLGEINYGYDGSILYEEKHTYQNGRLIETARKHSPFSYLSDKVVYKYDAGGNMIEESGYDLTGKLVSHTIYEFDQRNRKTSWTSRSYFEKEDQRPHRWTYIYDEYDRVREEKAYRDEGKGFIPTDALGGPHRKLHMYPDNTRSNTTAHFNSDGEFVGSSLSKYDGQGNELEDIRFERNGELKEKTKYTYIFDRFKNWTVQKTYEWDTENGKSFYRLEEISYQIITYY